MQGKSAQKCGPRPLVPRNRRNSSRVRSECAGARPLGPRGGGAAAAGRVDGARRARAQIPGEGKGLTRQRAARAAKVSTARSGGQIVMALVEKVPIEIAQLIDRFRHALLLSHQYVSQIMRDAMSSDQRQEERDFVLPLRAFPRAFEIISTQKTHSPSCRSAFMSGFLSSKMVTSLAPVF